MRGKPALSFSTTSSGGITPADAGKTIFALMLDVARQDHPRGCGENAKNEPKQANAVGSPPRMRGKRLPHSCGITALRITPADAGKTRQRNLRAETVGDHPRGCGENTKRRKFGKGYVGSPPRMRGKRFCRLCAINNRRITPADAGKTRTLRPFRPKSGDHPRGCGENENDTRRLSQSRGSPPRMRGKQAVVAGTVTFDGITPADAGKTRSAARSLPQF